MTKATQQALLGTLSERFAANMARHKGMRWDDVAARLDAKPKALAAIGEMERTGGEPDVVGREGKAGAVFVMDCAAESPTGRRSLCYDGAARKARKAHKPKGSALEMAAEMGVELLSEDEYRMLQELGEFDLKSSSWIQTPADIRKRGGALFCDRRYDHVFTYHNGAESYYAARGFRAVVRV